MIFQQQLQPRVAYHLVYPLVYIQAEVVSFCAVVGACRFLLAGCYLLVLEALALQKIQMAPEVPVHLLVLAGLALQKIQMVLAGLDSRELLVLLEVLEALEVLVGLLVLELASNHQPIFFLCTWDLHCVVI